MHVCLVWFCLACGACLLRADSGCTQICHGDLGAPAVTSVALPQVWIISRASQVERPGKQSRRMFPTHLEDFNILKGDYNSCLLSLCASRQGQQFRCLITSKGKALRNWNRRWTSQNLLAEWGTVCLIGRMWALPLTWVYFHLGWLLESTVPLHLCTC